MTQAESTPLTMRTAVESAETTKRFAETTKFRVALPVLLANPMMEAIPPVIFLKAAGEGLFLTLLLSWILTEIYDPDVIAVNPLKQRLGYNNLCVGWDSPPANYVAAVLWIFVAYLALRFCFMNHVRFHLSRTTLGGFDFIANALFAIAVCVFTLCLMIPPDVSVWIHTIPFIGYIVTRFLIVLALCLEEWNTTLPGRSKVFIYIYGFISATLPIIYLSEYAYYSRNGAKSPWPYQITFVLDYSWFACLAVTSKFLPSSIVIHRAFELVDIHSGVRTDGEV